MKRLQDEWTHGHGISEWFALGMLRAIPELGRVGFRRDIRHLLNRRLSIPTVDHQGVEARPRHRPMAMACLLARW